VVVPLTSSGGRTGENGAGGPTPVEPAPPPVVVPSPPPVTPPVETKIPTVNITVKSQPPGAEIYWGDVFKGTTPSTIAFNRNDETIKLTLDLKGYAEAEVPFQPSKDDTVSVKLRPLKKGEVQRKKPAGAAATPAGANKDEPRDDPDLKDSPFGKKAPPK
jgi:hypothetical protein